MLNPPQDKTEMIVEIAYMEDASKACHLSSEATYDA